MQYAKSGDKEIDEMVEQSLVKSDGLQMEFEMAQLEGASKAYGTARQNVWFYSAMTFLPPIVAFLLSMGLMWAFSGFAKKTERIKRST